MTSASLAINDHRSRTAAARREQMRRRLLESALVVMAERGVEAAVIDDIISRAGVSRGSFYKYFPTIADLMQAAAHEVAAELLTLVTAQVQEVADPVARVASGSHIFLTTIQNFPVLARFILCHGPGLAGPTALVDAYLLEHLREGVRIGRFRDLPLAAMSDLVTGPILKCVARSIEGGAGPDYCRALIAGILQALGVTPTEAWSLAGQGVAPLLIPEQSLLRRTQAAGDPPYAPNPPRPGAIHQPEGVQ